MGADVRIAEKGLLATRNAKTRGQYRELKSDLDFAALKIEFETGAHAMRFSATVKKPLRRWPVVCLA
jgi:hypothetical protein